LSSKDEVQTVQLACPEFIEGFNRYAPFKSLANGIEHSLDLLVMGTNFTLELSQFLRQFLIG
jgi:hypothetical protein